MKTIIISDLHNRVGWIEEALSSPILQPYDKIVLLGDYFDDYGDSSKDIRKAAKWLKESLKQPNRIHLVGTHDMWYRFPNNMYLQASGNTSSKLNIINEILTKSDWEKIKPFYYEQNFLLTHAGVHLLLISDYVSRHKQDFAQYIINGQLELDAPDIVNKIIKPATDEALKAVEKGYPNEWFGAGYCRGGIQIVGGITWLDWIHEFEPIPNINQIVGHTELNLPDAKITPTSKNYDLDTRNHEIGILENGIFVWIENPLI